MSLSMRVIKRNGQSENVSFDKVLQRIRRAARGLSINPDGLAQQVLSQIYDGVKTTELDDLTARLAASLTTTHPDWASLAGSIAVSNHHKQTEASFAAVMLRLSAQKTKNGTETSYISEEVLALCRDPTKAAAIEATIDYGRDYQLDYFGLRTLSSLFVSALSISGCVLLLPSGRQTFPVPLRRMSSLVRRSSHMPLLHCFLQELQGSS